MPVPQTDEFRRPTLEALAEGAPLSNERIQDRVQGSLGLSDSDRAEMPPKGPTPVFTNYVAWALVDLQRRGFIEKTAENPNTYKITDDGQRALTEGLQMLGTSPRREPRDYSAGDRRGRRSGVVPPERPLVAGETYTWTELGARFNFSPNYLDAAGGMVSRPGQNALRGGVDRAAPRRRGERSIGTAVSPSV
jgi:hypothetical protein